MYVIHREAAISSEEQVYIQVPEMEVTAAYSPKGTGFGRDDSGALLVPGYKVRKEGLEICVTGCT